MIVVKATFNCSTLCAKSCGDHWHCIKTQTFASVFRHHCSSPDTYKSGQKWFKVVIRNVRDTSLYECQSLIFNHLSCIRHPVCDTSFGRHLRSLFGQLHTHTHTQKKKIKKNATENFSVPHGARNKQPFAFLFCFEVPSFIWGAVVLISLQTTGAWRLVG